MAEEKLLSRAELAATAQVDEAAVVFWIRNGLLRSSETGERKHRRFDSREVKLAALLREARGCGMNVGTMRAMVQVLREALKLYDSIPHCVHLASVIGSAMDKGADDPLGRNGITGLLEQGHVTEAEAEEMYDAAAATPQGRIEEMWLAFNFTHSESVMLIYRDENGDLRAATDLPADGKLPAPSAIAFDFAKIFR